MPDTHIKHFSPEAQQAIHCLSDMAEQLRAAYTISRPSLPDMAALYDAGQPGVYRSCLVALLSEIDLTRVLAESGIPQGNSFMGQTARIIKGWMLPYVYDERDLRIVAKKIFYHREDAAMLKSLLGGYATEQTDPDAQLPAIDTTLLQIQLENAARIISYRIAALGMEEEMAIRAGRDETLITPFLEQNREINDLLLSIEKGDRAKAAEDHAQSVIMLKQCLDNIHKLDKAAAENGASLQQTFILNKCSLLIGRLTTILVLIHEIEEQVKVNGLFGLMSAIVLEEISTKKLREFIGGNIQQIAYRITENKRRTGEHYITTGRDEYYDMFVSACGGGFIVALMVIVKLMLHHAALPVLWEGIAYSLLYAGGFALIFVLNFTLATKQPAMTAAFIAASLDEREAGDTDYEKFATLVASVSRSQLISFAGNLLIAFPVSICLIALVHAIAGDYFLSDAAAVKMLQDIHPLRSLSVLYAAIAGVFLFVSGLVSGFWDNKVIVSRIALRIYHHPWLNRKLSHETLTRISTYTEHNLGSLLGNIIVGFFFGMTIFVGHITGLPLDIRHVTFSTGNLALGLCGSHFHLSASALLALLLGIILIGFINFFVSFSLALQVALRSRGLRLRDYSHLFISVFRYFRRHPREFFWP